MDTQSTLSSLNLFTLVAVLAVLIGMAVWFFRKRENRHPMGKNEGLHTNLDAAAARADDPRRDKR